MPSSHGGGSSFHGSHSSYSSSHSTPRTYSRRPFVGSRRYYYVNSLGNTCYFYAATSPKRKNGKAFLGLLAFMSIFFAIFALMIVTAYPKKLNSNKCEMYHSYIIDNANIIDDESSLSNVLESFYEKSGVQPVLYTISKADYTSNYNIYTASGIEDYAYDIYIRTFTDEGHFLVVCVYNSENDYMYVDMSGNDTNRVVNDTLFEMFQNSFEDSQGKSLDVESCFYNAFSTIENKVLTKESANKEQIVIGYILIVVFVAITVLAYISQKKENKAINEYCDYRDANGGEDFVDDIDPYKYSNQKSTTTDKYEKF